MKTTRVNQVVEATAVVCEGCGKASPPLRGLFDPVTLANAKWTQIMVLIGDGIELSKGDESKFNFCTPSCLMSWAGTKLAQHDFSS